MEKAARGVNARFGFTQAEYHRDYFISLLNSLSGICSGKYTESSYRDIRTGKIYKSTSFWSKALPMLNEFYQKFYVDKVKIVPLDLSLLTPLAFAHWVMQDGSLGTSKGLYLCTDSFTHKDVMRLTQYLIKNYNINCSIHKAGKNHRIYISAKSLENVKNIILPFMNLVDNLSFFYWLTLYKQKKMNENIKSISLPEIKSFQNKRFLITHYNILKETIIYSSPSGTRWDIGKQRIFCTISTPRNRALWAWSQPAYAGWDPHPYFVTGFTDGEGSFYISLNRRISNKSGWNVLYGFSILISEKDGDLLQKIKLYFGVGNIRRVSNNKLEYRVSNVKDLINVIIPHFEKYPLLTKKQADFILFKSAIYSISQGKHLTKSGIDELVSIKASMNRGLSSALMNYFPAVIPVKRPVVESLKINDPNWLSGFTNAEGCFYVSVVTSKTKIGYAVHLWFILTQHSRDIALFEVIKKYLHCGNLTIKTQNSVVRYKVSKFTDNFNVIIPFFLKYPFHGVKKKDFTDFCKVAYLMSNKAHLTFEGLQEIKKIQKGMNTGREGYSL